MTGSTEKLNREKALALPLLELEASAIIPMDAAEKKQSRRLARSWWAIALELALAASILLFFL